MKTSIYHYKKTSFGDIIMDEVKSMLRETKVPKNMVEVRLGFPYH